MAVNALAVANHFLDMVEKEGQRLTPMKLQKLVYFAHGWHLGLTGEPLLDEEIQAWSFGPVVRSVYNAFRDCGGDEITHKGTEFVPDIAEDAPPLGFCVRTPALDDYPTEKVGFIRRLLGRIWDVYGGYTAIQLTNMTHEQGTPWYAVWERHGGKIPKYATIPNDLIRDYFQTERRNSA